MSWFLFALFCLLCWGFADLFYKKSSDNSDNYSHLKIAVWVGLTMGVCSLLLLRFAESLSPANFLNSLVRYLPASLSYIVSMVIGYVGLRYLEVSIVSPVQNASGAFSSIAMILFFVLTDTTSVQQLFAPTLPNVFNLVGTELIVVAVVCLAVVERNETVKETPHDKRFTNGALALLFPILYCVFDTVGTAFDGIILDENVGLSLGEIDVLVLYGLTFFLCGVIAYVILWVKTKKPYNPFAKEEIKTKCVASLFEQGGQVFYVFAMAKNPVVSAPMIASYCIVSVVLSRIFLKEKLSRKQYACVIAVIIGIVLLGVSEGLSSL